MEQITPDFHTVDADIWNVIKYLLVLFIGVLIWQAQRLVGTQDKMANSLNDLAKDIAVMKSNSDNTKEQLHRIVGDLDEVSEKIKDHEARIIHIERKVKVS